MPKILRARAAESEKEESTIRKLTRSRHAPQDVIQRAQIVEMSWKGERVPQIANLLSCHEQTVRRRIHAFNDRGVDGLEDAPRSGRKRRITEAERSRIIGLVGSPPPGRLMRQHEGDLRAEDDEGHAHWTLDALTEAAQAGGIQIERSQVRRILMAEGVRWQTVRSWQESNDPDFEKKERSL